MNNTQCLSQYCVLSVSTVYQAYQLQCESFCGTTSFINSFSFDSVRAALCILKSCVRWESIYCHRVKD